MNNENIDDEIISVNFASMAFQDIQNYSIPCKVTDKFTKLEERLLIDYPRLRKHELIFEINGQKIQKNKTLKENNIKQNSIINVSTVKYN